MANKRTSRLIRIGNTSFAVVVPRDWVRGNDLEDLREVELVYDGEITIRRKVEARGKDSDHR